MRAIHPESVIINNVAKPVAIEVILENRPEFFQKNLIQCRRDSEDVLIVTTSIVCSLYLVPA